MKRFVILALFLVLAGGIRVAAEGLVGVGSPEGINNANMVGGGNGAFNPGTGGGGGGGCNGVIALTGCAQPMLFGIP